MKLYECYHAICQYSADACNRCEYEMDCYKHFLSHMMRDQNKNKEDADNKNRNNDTTVF